jgi:hypothetical protein
MVFLFLTEISRYKMNSRLIKYAPLASSVVTLVVYFFTMSRGVMPIDAGELAASQYSLGISHPSGYPLFNLLGFVWSKIPIGSVIFRLNLLCAIWVALANFFMVKTTFLVLKNTPLSAPGNKTGAKKGEKITADNHPLLQILAAVSGILILAFCKTWWVQSAGVEVYSLHVALLALFFFIFIKTYYLPAPGKKNWLMVGLVLGLCFTNHLTSILILPGVIILYFLKMKFNRESLVTGLILAGGFTLVFVLLYGFMMMRAAASPLANFGNPYNMEYLQRHITGWQFKSFVGGKNDSVANFFTYFTNQTGVVGLLLFLTGLVFVFMKNSRMGIFWGLHLLCTVIYISQYNIHDIENYFLLGYMSMAVLMSLGLYGLFTLIKGIENNKAIYLIVLLPALPMALNYTRADQSKLHYIDEYSVAALNSVEDNAIILSREWDVFVSPMYYYHLVEKRRPDVLILDKELLRRSWFYNQIKTWDPQFAGKVEKQALEFNEAVMPFERNITKDGAKIQPKFEAYITSILNEYKNRPVYISSLVLDADVARGIDVKLPPGTILVPDAYFFRVVPADTTTYYPLANPLEYNVNFTEDKKENKFQRLILNASMNVLSARVGYEMGFGKKAEARKIVELMQGIDPSIQMPEGL